MRFSHEKLKTFLEVLELVNCRGVFLQREEQVIEIELMLDHDHVVLLLLAIGFQLVRFLSEPRCFFVILRSEHLFVLRALRN